MTEPQGEIPEELVEETQRFIRTYAIAIIKWLSEEPEPEDYPLLEGYATMDREFVIMLIARIGKAYAEGGLPLPGEEWRSSGTIPPSLIGALFEKAEERGYKYQFIALHEDRGGWP